jgi:hypothetical protein
MSEHLWLLEKRGLYYRPNGQGYTGIKDHAGRYTEADACSHMVAGNGVSRIREDHAPEFSKACFEDLARKHLSDQRDAMAMALRTIEQNDRRWVGGQEPAGVEILDRRLVEVDTGFMGITQQDPQYLVRGEFGEIAAAALKVGAQP